MMAHKVSISVFVLILLCCDVKGVLEVEVSIDQEYSRTGLLNNTNNGTSEKPAISPSPQIIRSSCPPPYERIATHCLHLRCYVWTFGMQGWETARQYCKSVDGDLAWFEDEDLPLVMGHLHVVNLCGSFRRWEAI
ncbi:uncharacterized protein [Macrobrachium rosenbergii]|uniref:uncharacterized protein n=1 Tax=Macrobrachium rosenbergii TaxID=79674 RepID=UPI0034D4657B